MSDGIYGTGAGGEGHTIIDDLSAPKKVPTAQALEIMYIAQRLYGAADVLPADIASFVRSEAHALSQAARRIDKAD